MNMAKAEITNRAIMTLAKALEEARGLDGHMIGELDLSADDLISVGREVALVLAGYTVAPEWTKNALIAAGAIAIGGDALGIAANVFGAARMQDVQRRLGVFDDPEPNPPSRSRMAG